MIRCIIADDHDVTRVGIRTVIERLTNDIKIVGEANNGNDFLTVAEKIPAHVYIVDIKMPGLNGIEAIRLLIKRNPEAKVLILSMFNDADFIERALDAGALGYVLKDTATREIATAIRQVHKGGRYYSNRLADSIGDILTNGNNSNTSKINSLSARELEVLKLIADGLKNQEIASTLTVSPDTIHTHKRNIMKKLNIEKTNELVIFAHEQFNIQENRQ